jgi:hypothetical protein
MLFLSFFFLFFISCSDNILYNEAAPHIFVEVLNHSDVVSVGDAVRFQAIISPLPEDMEIFWSIENENSPNHSYYYSDTLLFEIKFTKSGLYNVKFYAKDRFSDAYESNLFIRVSNPPVCDDMSLEIFQGSPIFKWNCIDIDMDGDDSLTYRFLLYNGYSHLDITLTENSLQLGDALQEDYIAYLVATNKYGIKTVRSLP